MSDKVRERGIIMAADSVRAIIAGRKTQTRRVVKPQPPKDAESIWVDEILMEVGRRVRQVHGAYDEYSEWAVRCPYGAPGDRLWVKEAWTRWCSDEGCDKRGHIAYRADASAEVERERDAAVERADQLQATICGLEKLNAEGGRVDATFSGVGVREVAIAFAELLRESNATNYVEMQMTDPKGDERFTVTVQRVTGKTPHELRLEAEAAIAQAMAEARRRALESCALVCELLSQASRRLGYGSDASAQQACADAIRAMSRIQPKEDA